MGMDAFGHCTYCSQKIESTGGCQNPDCVQRALGNVRLARRCPDCNTPLQVLKDVGAEICPNDQCRTGLRSRLGAVMLEKHKLQIDGAFSVDRDPFDLMPAIDAYAHEEMSGGKMRECIRRWLAGASFREPAERDWEVQHGTRS